MDLGRETKDAKNPSSFHFQPGRSPKEGCDMIEFTGTKGVTGTWILVTLDPEFRTERKTRSVDREVGRHRVIKTFCKRKDTVG